MADKKKDDFVHLHSHADTSILDGFSTVPEILSEVARLGQPALAITDHGNMHGIYELFKHAKALDIKPIAGIEAYMTPSTVNRHHHAPAYLGDGGRDDIAGRGSYTHITLLAENNIGLKNLYQMQLLSYTEGFYQKNRIDFELLEKYGKGIIATTGCPSGEVQTRLRLGQEKEALAYAARLQEILGKENVFMELMEHGMASELERGVRNQLLDIAKKLNMPLVATNDLHYARHEDSKGHEELLCVQTRSVMSNPPEYTGNGTRFAFEGDEYYVKSRAEMEKYFSHLPEALDNTLLIAERCDITIEPDDSLRPTVTPPSGMTEAEFLREQAFAGLKKRLPDKADDPEYIERLNSELGIIELKNYVGYFLVVSDFVRWGKFTAEPPVPTGFGRGCLSADTNVLTPLGFKKIKDIKVGDTVFDELGNQVVVPQVFEYDCDEPLLKIETTGGFSNKMTFDHKILVAKNAGQKPTWLRADEVQVGDFTVKPATNGFEYIEVSTITEVPSEGKVYDFTVPTTNSYVTDSYVVHNSAAGSLLGYCLDITDVDPIKYDLLFERFINPERDSPPDIDMDFNDTDRERVIEYVKHRYGLDKVAQIVTFGKIGAKAAIKDSVRILEKPYSMGDELSKALPEPVAGHPITLAEVYDPSAERYGEAGEFRTLVGKLDAQDVIDVSRAFEGRTRSTGVHAAALVVSTKPVVETVPMMQRQADGAMITQWDYPTCESLGLLKVDFLGLRNLGIIDKAIKNVYKTKGIQLDIQEIIQGDMDDKKTYELLTRGDSLGVFQLDSSGLRSLMKLLRPTSFQDISALIALYRPGPMGVNAHNDYALRKNGEQEVTPIHPELKEPLAEILDETYGLICYQEQIMRIAQKVADYSLAQADNLRRAMGKKKKSVLDAEYVPFSEGMKKNGYSDEAIKALWEILIPFADYGFNKCVSSRTKIRHSDGTAWEASEILKAYNNGEDIYLMAMWPDGEVRPHKVAKVVSTGIKPVFRLKTANGRSIEATHDHRLLTTRGYIKIEDMIVGQDELIVADKIYSEKQKENAISNIRKSHNLPLTTKQIAARSKTMSKWNNSDSPEKLEQNARAAERMRKYQSKLTFEDRSAHQKYIDSITDRGDKIARIMRDKKAYMWENDPDFREKVITSLSDIRRSNYDTGSGFGTTCFASNGMLCDSKNELRMAEFLIANDIEFEMHKLVGKGECDFYFAGLYWEMDGMDRHISYFENKYGDIPFVVVTPEDYMEKICTILEMEHVRNGDLIISIEPVSKRLGTIDIEMESDGPKNYLTWKGIVSHNSHSVGYGVLSYLTAYLKANYPAEFMSALLSSVADDTDKTALYLEDCKNMGIKVLPPDINTSQADYAPLSDTRINFGFKAIRGVGDKVAEELVEIRGSEKFTDIHDFVNRVPKALANKRILEALTLGGAFDSLGIKRRAMMDSIPDITAAITKANRKPTKTQLAKLAKEGISEEEALAMKNEIEFELLDVEEYSKLEKLKLERHALGLYISGHPLEGLDLSASGGNKVSDYVNEIIKPIDGWVPRDAKPLKLSGIVTSLSKKRTKKGETFAIGTVEDLTGAIPFVMFPKAYAQYGEFLQLDGVYQMQGFPRKRDIDGINFTVDMLRPLEFSDSGKLSLRVKLTEKQWASGRIALIERLERHKTDGDGSTNVIVSIKNEEGEVWEEVLDFTVKANPALTQEIRELFGMLSIGRWRKI